MSKNSSSGGITLKRIAFWSIVIVAVAYAFTAVLTKFDISWEFATKLANWMQTIAIALMAVVTLFVAYGYVKYRKDAVWHVLYWVCALIVIATVIWVGFF